MDESSKEELDAEWMRAVLAPEGVGVLARVASIAVHFEVQRATDSGAEFAPAIFAAVFSADGMTFSRAPVPTPVDVKAGEHVAPQPGQLVAWARSGFTEASGPGGGEPVAIALFYPSGNVRVYDERAVIRQDLVQVWVCVIVRRDTDEAVWFVCPCVAPSWVPGRPVRLPAGAVLHALRPDDPRHPTNDAVA